MQTSIDLALGLALLSQNLGPEETELTAAIRSAQQAVEQVALGNDKWRPRAKAALQKIEELMS